MYLKVNWSLDLLLLASSYFQDFIVFAKRKKLKLFIQKVIQVKDKLCEAVHWVIQLTEVA